jgi:RNA polymerase sigma-70 factor (ECF subfamily)
MIHKPDMGNSSGWATRTTTDWECYRRARRGDEDAWRCLLERHHSRLVKMTYLITGSLAAAHDLAQETLIILLRRGVRHQQGSFGAYLSTIAYHLALKEKKRVSRLYQLDGSGAPDCAASPLDTILQAERDRLIAEAIRSLDGGHRDVLVLRLYGRHSYAEIARMMNLPLGTIKSRIFYAVKTCRNILRQKGVLE